MNADTQKYHIVAHKIDKIKLWKGTNLMNKIRTSRNVDKKASKQLRSNKTSRIQKSVAASALRNRAKK